MRVDHYAAILKGYEVKRFVGQGIHIGYCLDSRATWQARLLLIGATKYQSPLALAQLKNTKGWPLIAGMECVPKVSLLVLMKVSIAHRQGACVRIGCKSYSAIASDSNRHDCGGLAYGCCGYVAGGTGHWFSCDD